MLGGAWCSQLLAAGEDRKVRVYAPGSGARLRWLSGARLFYTTLCFEFSVAISGYQVIWEGNQSMTLNLGSSNTNAQAMKAGIVPCSAGDI